VQAEISERELAKEAVKTKRESKRKKVDNIRSKGRGSDTNQVEFEING
jgi:hypothetical protein